MILASLSNMLESVVGMLQRAYQFMQLFGYLHIMLIDLFLWECLIRIHRCRYYKLNLPQHLYRIAHGQPAGCCYKVNKKNKDI
jgi:hypothetical protein